MLRGGLRRKLGFPTVMPGSSPRNCSVPQGLGADAYVPACSSGVLSCRGSLRLASSAALGGAVLQAGSSVGGTHASAPVRHQRALCCREQRGGCSLPSISAEPNAPTWCQGALCCRVVLSPLNMDSGAGG